MPKLDYDSQKREHYYKVFADFDPVAIAKFDEQKVAELMQDAGIIRNRLKIQAIITNAKAYLKITENQSFSDYLWAMSPNAVLNGLTHQTLVNRPKTLADGPCQNGGIG